MYLVYKNTVFFKQHREICCLAPLHEEITGISYQQDGQLENWKLLETVLQRQSVYSPLYDHFSLLTCSGWRVSHFF